MSLSVSGKSRTCKWIIKLSRGCVLFCYQEVTWDQMCPGCPFCTSFRSIRICATLKRESTFLFYFCQYFYTMQIFNTLCYCFASSLFASVMRNENLPRKDLFHISYMVYWEVCYPEERAFISNWFINSFIMVVYENYFSRTFYRNFWLNFK